MLIKYILSKSKQFVKWLWLSLRKLGKWVLRPKVYKSILGILVFLIPLLWGFYTYYDPKVDIDFTDPLFDGDITTSIFSIKNEGNCNIYNVRVDIYNKKFETEKARVSENLYTNYSSYKRIKSNREQALDYGIVKNNSFYLGSWENVNTINAELHIYITYTYWKNTMTKFDTLKFKSSKLVKNKIIWTKIQ